MTDKVPYELLGGEEGVRKLCNAMYDAIDTLPEAQIIRQMHEENLSEICKDLETNLAPSGDIEGIIKALAELKIEFQKVKSTL